MSKHAVIILSLFMALTSCGREPVAPVPSDGTAFNWMNNPDGGSVRISRVEEGFIACWSDGAADAATGLRACHSTFPLGGDTPDPDCGPQEKLDPIQIQRVGIEEADLFTSWLRQNAKGVLWITVRDLNQPGTCFGSRLVAEGWGTFHNNDNDLFGTAPGDKNANAWRLAAQGRLLTPTKRIVTYNGHLHFVFNNSVGFKELSAQVAVN